MRGLIWAGLLSAASVGACAEMRDQSVEDRWILQSLGGTAADFVAEIDLTTPGAVSGKGPCNSFAGKVEGEVPDMAFGPLRMTRRACPQMAEENAFVQALQAVSTAELRDGELVLTGETGDDLVFIPAP